MAQPVKIAKIGDVIHASVFLALLCLPLAARLFRSQEGEDLRENRALARPPRIGVDPIAALPRKFESYYNDHFGLRNELIRAHDLLLVGTLGAVHSTQVVIGRDDWLFFADEDQQGLLPFTQQQLDAWQEVLEGRQAWLAQQGVAYLFVVAPNKESVYPELLPSHLQRPSAQTRLDQLVDHLHRNSRVEILDLRPVLRAARQAGEVYYPLDTHWSPRGAMAAYQAVCHRLKQRFPEMEPMRTEDFRVVRGSGCADLCPMIGWHEVSRDCEHFVPRRAGEAKRVPLVLDPNCRWPTCVDTFATERPGGGRRLLMFHDSFMAHDVREHLAEHFARSVCLWMSLDFDALSRMVAQERPDVVVEEWVERSLRRVPSPHPAWTAARAGPTTLLR